MVFPVLKNHYFKNSVISKTDYCDNCKNDEAAIMYRVVCRNNLKHDKSMSISGTQIWNSNLVPTSNGIYTVTMC